ncbi:hypothetical protein EIN_495530 [Entamoeba invadens IP1]|uniref:UPF3 domain-containing protein n=1 Tax=Entamoeba invadens IP1 TaxID=370355 RepID=A0A0A1U5L9_ENTIV|nr:hypothetical protein EIN_495530 [Entamoeba invadens IP1]ELP87098.1 hypothetical protein EIN_495530 [Entamoeba invadens IP1]|eukprot:XP_004253869.1 hypothetical protein EIN_495530 [Entamoeba invadens IP1]
MAEATSNKRKIIIKNIPTSNGKEIADDMVEGFQDQIDYYDFIAPQDNLFCSAIVHFTSDDALNKFNSKYSNHVCFLPGGQEKKISIEFCVNQRISTQDKEDTLNNTLQDDPEYIKFLETLKK